MWQPSQYFSVLESARLAFVRVADDVLGRACFLADQFPLGSGGKAGTAHAAQACRLELAQDALRRLVAISTQELPEQAIALFRRRVGIAAKQLLMRLYRLRQIIQRICFDYRLHRRWSTVDASGRCAVATAQAGDLANLHAALPLPPFLHTSALLRTIGKPARHVTA